MDLKSRLCKVTKKEKTICWVSIWEKYLKSLSIFNNKAEEVKK